MSAISSATARAAADVQDGSMIASVEIPAPAARVFRALSSPEITDWWVRPGVFDTREWTGDVRKGGTWQASGMGGGRPYRLEGEFLEVDSPRKLVHTWALVPGPGAVTTVTYLLDEAEGTTRVTLRHAGFTSGSSCVATCIGWETSFEKLSEILVAEVAPKRR